MQDLVALFKILNILKTEHISNWKFKTVFLIGTKFKIGTNLKFGKN
jgi:hypothetical protein